MDLLSSSLNAFRSILALVLAILVASPLCCCASGCGDGAPERAACCQALPDQDDGQAPDKEPHVCACKVKNPRDEAKAETLPVDPGLTLLPLVQDLSYLCPSFVARLPVANTPYNGCDPPRLLLARYARWLI